MNWRRHIATERAGRDPLVLRRTDVPVAAVLGSLAAARDLDAVCQAYGLTPLEVRACLACAAVEVAAHAGVPQGEERA